MNNNYYCDNCGYSINFPNDNMVNKQCPICKRGYFVYEDIYKDLEETRNAIGNNEEDNLTPKQDMEEEREDFLISAMEKNINELGNEEVYKKIEDIKEAKNRTKERKYFILAGGYIPMLNSNKENYIFWDLEWCDDDLC